MIEGAALIVAGVAIGFLGGLFGIGGGLFVTPLLVLCFGVSQGLAQGTALFVSCCNVSLALTRYRGMTVVSKRVAITVAVAALAPNAVAGYVVARFSTEPLRVGFGIFLFILALLSLYPQRLSSPRFERRSGVAATIGVSAGLLNGIFGAGGGLVAVPLLRAAYGLSQAQAQAVLLLVSLPIIVPSLCGYALHHDVDWSRGLFLALAGTISVPTGVRAAHRLKDALLRGGFASLLVFAACLLFLRRG